MFSSIVKNTIILFMSFYLGDKLKKSFYSSAKTYISYFGYSFLLAIITVFLKNTIPYLSYLLPALGFIATFCILHKSRSYSIIGISLTSYVFNLIFFQLISFIFCIILILIFHDKNLISQYTVALIVCAFYPITMICLLKNRGLFQGVSSIIFNGMVNYNTFICFTSLGLLTLEQSSPPGYSQMRILRAPIIFLCLAIILFWWRTQITKTYREKLRLLEMKTLRAAKVENEAYISRLEAENKRLGTIIHKDNRIVNAMADSVCDYLSTASTSDLEALQTKGLSLSDEINSIKTYRQELLCEGPFVENSIPHTNLAGVDAIISFMLKEASTHGITLQFHFDKEVFSSKHFTASEMDLVHLLSDLLQNAIIATRHAGGKSIELSFQSLKGTPAISVSDSGIPFEIDTYMKLGMCEASTHLEEGGTGIGLIDIWSFKKKYHASLVIEELDDSIYTKRLSLLFDAKNKYLIVSNRYQQIISSQTRSDLLVIAPVTNELVELIEE